MRAGRLGLVLGVLLAAGFARAADKDDHWYNCHHREWPGKQPYGQGEPAGHTDQRAGYPREVSCLARPDDAAKRDGYFVGGGCPCKGTGPTCQEGTWGWDYAGCRVLRPKVALNWCRCKYQGGTGAYKIDGPHVPDVVPILKEAARGPQCHRGCDEHE